MIIKEHLHLQNTISLVEEENDDVEDERVKRKVEREEERVKRKEKDMEMCEKHGKRYEKIMGEARKKRGNREGKEKKKVMVLNLITTI